MKDRVDAVVLLGHGSRVEMANNPLVEVAKLLSGALDGLPVVPAFLQLARPSLRETLEDLYRSGARKVAVMPLFLFPGAHVLEDIPGEVEKIRGEYPDFELFLSSPIGAHPKLVEIAVERITEAIT